MGMRNLLFASLALALAACAASDEPADETMIPVEPDGGIGDGATPLAEPTDERASRTMPAALRGQWREDDLGRDPTEEDCDQTSSTNQNFGKVLTVRADGYSLFEEGGEIAEVHNRSDRMIDATFAVPTPNGTTPRRKDFALQSDDTLAVNDDDGDGRMSVTQYRPCPGN